MSESINITTNTNTTPNVDDLKTKCFNSITELFEKYKDHEYMLQRINTHIVNYLPNSLSNECKIYEDRLIRNNYLSNEQQIFIQVFLSKNQYFYLQSNNFFYEYNGSNFLIVKEDDIIHKLLSSISKDRVLISGNIRQNQILSSKLERGLCLLVFLKVILFKISLTIYIH